MSTKPPSEALAALVAVVKSKWPDIDWDLDTSAWGAPMRYAMLALAPPKPLKGALADVSAGTFGSWRLAPGIDAHYIMQGDHCIASCDEHDDAEAIMVLARAAGLA